MNVAPFFRVAAGVVVSPEIPSATGNYQISTEPGGKTGTSFPAAVAAVSGKFWPLNGKIGPSDPLRNMLSLSLNPLTTTAVHPHKYWVCYGGWNTTGLDADGVVVANISRDPVLLSLYNRTPYVMQWGISETFISDPALFVTGQRLLPGACVAIDGSVQPLYYQLSGSWYYGITQGVGVPGSFLNVRCMAEAIKVYDRTTAAPLNGYLEIVIAQASTEGWLPANFG